MKNLDSFETLRLDKRMESVIGGKFEIKKFGKSYDLRGILEVKIKVEISANAPSPPLLQTDSI